jgi:hypothetical protein
MTRRRTLNRLLLLFQLGSVVISLFVSRAIFGVITSRLSRGSAQEPSFFTTPGGSSLLFGITFVVVWFAVSSLAVVGWLWLRGGK